jgi:DNA-binding NtrC family response regulator
VSASEASALQNGYQIEALSGPLRARVWPVTHVRTVIGRGLGCHIRISDPLVSRQHCELCIEDGTLVLRDLGSSNSVLLNGQPVREASLHPGDRFSLAGSMFRVKSLESRVTPQGVQITDEADTAVTLSIDRDLYLQPDFTDGTSAATPRTILELHALFTLSRAFSMESTLTGLWERLHLHLRERFNPEHLWLAAYLPAERALLLLPTGPQEAVDVPRDWMLDVAERRRATLFPRTVRSGATRGLETTLVAPISCGEDIVGVVALSTAVPRGVYDESDLEYLLALTSTFAPFVRMAERREQLQRDQLTATGPRGPELLGSSPPMRALRDLVRKAAASRLPVLLLGESGTGKELVARHIHDLGPRQSQPYVPINCATLQPELFESEMFGHERGAFTGATGRRIGRFQEAHGGTLFLDEVADCSPDNQARMLRVLESGTFHRVGGKEEIEVDTRIVAATNKNVFQMMETGAFREDLYYRLGGLVIQLPPLREMREDIPVLAHHFLRRSPLPSGRRIEAFSQQALDKMQAWRWPGNVRELRICVERAMLTTESTTIQEQDITMPLLSGTPRPAPVSQEVQLLSLEAVERQHIERVLKHCGGKVRPAAKILGISYVTLYARLRDFGTTHVE